MTNARFARVATLTRRYATTSGEGRKGGSRDYTSARTARARSPGGERVNDSGAELEEDA